VAESVAVVDVVEEAAELEAEDAAEPDDAELVAATAEVEPEVTEDASPEGEPAPDES
jgi:hypothetical protein